MFGKGDAVGARLEEVAKGHIGNSQTRAQALLASQRTRGIGAATANPALAGRMAARSAEQAGVQIAGQEEARRQAASTQAMQMLEARRRERQGFARQLLGGAVGAAGSVLGTIVPGLGAATGMASRLAMGNEGGPTSAAEVAAQPGVQSLRETRSGRLPDSDPSMGAGGVMQALGVAPMPQTMVGTPAPAMPTTTQADIAQQLAPAPSPIPPAGTAPQLPVPGLLRERDRLPGLGGFSNLFTGMMFR